MTPPSRSIPALFLLAVLTIGCAGLEDYTDRMTAANEAANEEVQLDLNRDSIRVYNTKTKRYQYVERDTAQNWNEEEQRWEYTPTDQKEESGYLFEPDPE